MRQRTCFSTISVADHTRSHAPCASKKFAHKWAIARRHSIEAEARQDLCGERWERRSSWESERSRGAQRRSTEFDHDLLSRLKALGRDDKSRGRKAIATHHPVFCLASQRIGAGRKRPCSISSTRSR